MNGQKMMAKRYDEPTKTAAVRVSITLSSFDMVACSSQNLLAVDE